MAQPNVAREPSMEEILASIRRIIESNEPNAENALPHPLPQAYGDEEIEDSEEMNFGPDMAANDPGLPLRNEPVSFASPGLAAQQGQQPERTLSLADVAARVRAASARQQEARPAAPAPAAAMRYEEPQLPMAEFRGALPVAADPVEQAAPAAARPVMVQPEPVHQALAAFEPPRPAPRAEAPLRQMPKLAPEPAPQSLPAKIEEAANLLSAEAGAQVAKSFSELAAVFNGIERRSLEEMAGDMLRPMLQEWLDDNLPTLVERLVREEIERVARGPRR
ncbi:DUF2497 domain-containing protein [Rhizobium puerariae]|uniref:DUF2497 domain-containing protein n=1 Tax=Rhizobium puerariae TaxID=1585791 RepID=A0ABV6ANH0_9HYPH